MAGYEAIKHQLDDLNVAILGASADSVEDSADILNDVSFPIAVGVTKQQADSIGAWWNAERGIIQPSEFILDGEGKVVSSTYSSTPIGRIEPGDVVKRVNFLEKRKAQSG